MNMEFKETLLKKLNEKFPGVEFKQVEHHGDLSLIFNKKHILEVCRFLKDDEELSFILCDDITAIDWAKRKDRFTVVYNIFSLKNKFPLRLKVDVDESELNVDSVSSV